MPDFQIQNDTRPCDSTETLPQFVALVLNSPSSDQQHRKNETAHTVEPEPPAMQQPHPTMTKKRDWCDVTSVLEYPPPVANPPSSKISSGSGVCLSPQKGVVWLRKECEGVLFYEHKRARRRGEG
ncbi:hypothetical protein MRX96_041038 [Rhipicephalus microplus]